MVNGSPCGFFPSSIGVRQGDLLSLLLFVIVMEALGRLIEKTIGAGLLSGFSVNKAVDDPLMISHLLFTDDTLIFCEVVPEHLTHLWSILIWFEATSGLWINLGKSELVQVEDVPHFFFCFFDNIGTFLKKSPFDSPLASKPTNN